MLVFLLCQWVNGQTKCFGSDVGAASTDEKIHLAWAQKQDVAALKNGLKWKIEAIFNCGGITDEELYNFYGTLSVVIADYVPDAACFNGDKGVVEKDWYFHHNWAKTKGKAVAKSSLISKSIAAFDCLSREKQLSYYAKMSFHIAFEDPSNWDW